MKTRRDVDRVSGRKKKPIDWEGYALEVVEYLEREREACHLSRARSRIRELAFCNPWEHFVTITVDEANQNRTDVRLLKKRWNQCLKDYSAKYGVRPRYLIIPELHHDGTSWHLHGLFNGLAVESLCKNEHGYMDIPYFRGRFGWVSVSKIRDPKRCANYVTKYITKQFGEGAKLPPSGDHLYIASKGLDGATLLWSGDLKLPWQFENDYCAIYEGQDLEEVLQKGLYE